ncbi:type II toxin-antitoxin system Phd/YefM family antitoxin [Variovorax sp. AFSI2.2]|uniref:type II toxin-antitoxin system Phd/YefM family antitoxin n=1 Tax=Variovorax sp. AFSI2.2 TaxID=3384160 RepID=UPI003EB901EC
MSITVRDIVPFSSACAHLSELVEQVQNGAEKIIAKNGEPAVAMIDVKRLDHYHRLERASIHLLLLSEIEKGLADVAAGRSTNARERLTALKARRITR